MEITFDIDEKRRRVRIISDDLDIIKTDYSVANPAKRFNQRNFWVPDRIHAITKEGYVDFGLFLDIYKKYKENNICNITDKLKNFIKTQLSVFKKCPVKELDCDKKIRDYQLEAVNKMLSTGTGTCVVATGGGKTFIMATLINSVESLINGYIFVLVPDIGLVSQTYEDFIEYGIDPKIITKWTGDEERNPEAKIIIANMGILQSENSDISFLENVKLFIMDECHKLKRANKINKVIDKIKTINRFGFTGTLPEEIQDKWNIFGNLGPVIYEKTTTDLRQFNSYIAQCKIKTFWMSYKHHPDYLSTPAIQRFQLETDFIINSKFRNDFIIKIASKLNKNTLVMVDRITHGEILERQLKEANPEKEVYFIKGDVEVEDREKVKELMESKNNIICVAISKIFSTGISINNIHYILFAAIGKSKIKILQSIGRGLRMHPDKKNLVLIDFVDNLIYGERHYQQRKKFYERENIEIEEFHVEEK